MQRNACLSDESSKRLYETLTVSVATEEQEPDDVASHGPFFFGYVIALALTGVQNLIILHLVHLESPERDLCSPRCQ